MNCEHILFSRSILSRDGVLYVKLRAGQLPYKDDPQGWKSLLAPNLNNRSAEVRTFKVGLCARNITERASVHKLD